MRTAGSFSTVISTLRASVLAALLHTPAFAASEPPPPPEPLPEPLTLPIALEAANLQHPAIARAAANARLANAQHEAARAIDDARLDLSLQARRIDLPADSTLDENDSRAILSLQKTLYDFGRTGHASKATELVANAKNDLTLLAQQRQRLNIMRRYFDVILADLESARATEAMSISYVRFDNAKERHALGEITDIDLLALENTYQKDLREKNLADNRQRLSRAQLALALNRPEQLPSDLEAPDLPGLTTPLPEMEVLLEQARTHNLTLKALKNELESGLEKQAAARAERYPNLYVELQAAEYQQEFGSRSPFTAILGVDIPLYQGGRIDALQGTALAKTQQTKAALIEADYRLSEQILTLWQSIQQLTSQLDQADIQAEYRELYLDRSRAHYELEINTDLGDAMVAQSAARLFEAQTRFDLALARERLALLTQEPRYSALNPGDTPPTDKNTEATP